MSSWFGRMAAILGAMTVAAAPSFAQTTHIVDAVNLEFVPADITIQEGDSVRWINLQAGFHNVVSTDCPVDSSSVANGAFSSGNPGDVDEYTLQFNSAGTVCYLCEPHVTFDMFGTITVEPAGAVPTMGEWGLIAMGALLLGFGCYQLTKRQRLAVGH